MDEFMMTLLIIAIVVIIFGLLREFWVWYWKINHLLKAQEETNTLLKQLVNIQTTGKPYGNIEGEVIVEKTSTGEVIGISREEWDKIIKKNPKQNKYKLLEIV